MIRRFSFLMMFFVLILVVSCRSDDKDESSSGNNTPPRDDSHYPIASPSVVYLWLSGGSNGNLGGIVGANATCQEALAEEGSFETEVSTHRAFLSSSTQDARNFFANDPPVKRPDGLRSLIIMQVILIREKIWIVQWNSTLLFGQVCRLRVLRPMKIVTSGRVRVNQIMGESGSAGYIGGTRFSNGVSKCSGISAIVCISY